MKYYEIEQISNFLNQFKVVNNIVRVDKDIVKITFDKKNIFFFNMIRDKSFIFKRDDLDFFQFKKHSSPFDIALEKYISFSQIISIKTLNRDRVIEFTLSSKKSYKILKISIQFEFTGRYTNIIILNENREILEALRHVSEFNSFRVIKPNIKLVDLPKSTFEHKEFKKIENLDEYLLKLHQDDYQENLLKLKIYKIRTIEIKINKLKKLFLSLEDEKDLLEKSKKNREYANQILMNLYKIKNYDKYLIFKNEEKYRHKN